MNCKTHWGMNSMCTVFRISTMITVAMLCTGSASAGWLTEFSGVSDFQANCILCDSVVNFAVWETEGSSWRDDGLPAATFLGGTNQGIFGTEKYVYMYQVANTNQDGGTDNVIRDLTVQDPKKKFINAGNFEGNVFLDEGGAPIISGDIGAGNVDLASPDLTHDMKSGDLPASPLPNDNTTVDNDGRIGPFMPSLTSGEGIPGGVEDLRNPGDFIDDKGLPNSTGSSTGILPGGFMTDIGAEDPTSVIWDNLFSNGTSFGSEISIGQTFTFGSSPLFIDLDGVSSVVFLTADWAPATFLAGETESAGGSGAMGDLPYPHVPEPSTFAVWSALLCVLGSVTHRRRCRVA